MTASIFNLPLPTSPPPKIHISHTTIPQTYLDPSQPPTKHSPYRQLRDVPFIRSIQVCMPKCVHDALYPQPEPSSPPTGGLSSFQAQYSKLNLSLRDILDNEQLRKGNYLMLSSPNDGPVRLALNKGTLTFLLTHQIYQRSGLMFSATKLQTRGRKHEKGSAVYRMDVDLRQPSMARSKPGFARLMYAAKNVDGIREARLWLFTDLDDVPNSAMKGRKRKRDDGECHDHNHMRSGSGTTGEGTGQRAATATTTTTTSASTYATVQLPEQQHQLNILASHHPTRITDTGTTSTFSEVLIPPAVRNLPSLFAHLSSNTNTNTNTNTTTKHSSPPAILEEDINDIVEYLSLLFLQPPQITKEHYGKSDPYISQYQLPGVTLPTPASASALQWPESDSSRPVGEENLLESVKVNNLKTVKYSGLISSNWTTQLLVDLVRQSRVAGKELGFEAWVAINVKAHTLDPVGGKDGYMIVLHGDQGEGNGATAPVQRADADVDAMDVEDEGSVAEIGYNTGAVEVEAGKAGKKEGAKRKGFGFQSVTCFEFVDSITVT